jgi:hypothetical protein
MWHSLAGNDEIQYATFTTTSLSREERDGVIWFTVVLI